MSTTLFNRFNYVRQVNRRALAMKFTNLSFFYPFLVILTKTLAQPLVQETTTKSSDVTAILTQTRGLIHSFYYISRIIFYVPLYYQLYFCFYFLYLIYRSLYLHKVSSLEPTFHKLKFVIRFLSDWRGSKCEINSRYNESRLFDQHSNFD